MLVGLIAVTALLFAMVGSLNTLSERPGLEAWKAWTWSLTSAGAALPCTLICMAAVRYVSPKEWGWPRSVALHAAAAVVYAFLHVAGFVILRNLAYATMGDSYGLAPLQDEFPYELRKDALTYGVNAALFWIAGEAQRRQRPVRTEGVFEIHDGRRLIRVGTADILAVSSAGNYVEFWLEDGRRPLMRTTLAAIEVDLEPFGFVRSHRSWLINRDRVLELRPDGSGDWTVDLGRVEASVSRRYPAALKRLKHRSAVEI